MASFILSWTPAKRIRSSQTIQYKLSGTPSWTTKGTVGSRVDTYNMTGLTENKVYDFKVLATCLGNIKSTQIISGATLSCPSINASVVYNSSSVSISYSFDGADGTDVTKYIVELYDDKGLKLTYNQHLSPFANPITGSFSVNKSSSYKIKVNVFAGSTFTKTCESVDPIEVCIVINNISATLS